MQFTDEGTLRLRAETNEFNKALTGLNDEAKKLRATLTEIEKSGGKGSEEWKKTRLEIKANDDATKALVKSMKAMDVSSMTLKQLETHAKALAKEMSNSDRNTKEYIANAKRLGEVEKEIKKAKDAVIELKKSGEDLAKPTIWQRAKESITDFSAGAVIGLTGLMYGIKSAFGTAISEFKDFDKAAQSLKGETDMTVEMLEHMKKSAQEVGPTFGKTAKDMLDAYNVIASGKSEIAKTEEALKEVTNQAIILSTVGEMDVPEAAKTMTESLNQFGGSAKDAAKYVDIMATGTRVGAAKINEISESLKFVGPVAKAAGVSFGQTNAALQVLSQSGLKAEMAGTSLRGTLLHLANSTDKNINPTVVGLEKAFENLAKKGLSAAEMGKLVGTTNVSAALALTSNVGKLKAWTAEIEKGGGAAAMYADKTNTLDFQLNKAKATILNYAVSLGKVLTPALVGVIKYSFAFISGIIAIPKFLYDNRVAIGLLALGIGLMSKELIVTNGLILYNAAITKGKIIWDNASTVAMNAMRFAQLGLNTAMRANPIGFIIGLVVTLGSVFIALYNNSRVVRAGIAGLWNMLKEGATIISRVWTALKNLDFKAVATEMSGAMSKIGDAFTKGYAEKLKSEIPKAAKKAGNDAGKNLADGNKKGLDQINTDTKLHEKERESSAKKHLEEIQKANEEALKKLSKLQDDAYLEFIKRTQGEVAAEKVKVQQLLDEELLEINNSKANEELKGKLRKAALEKYLEQVRSLETKQRAEESELTAKWLDTEENKKIKSLQETADKDLAIARKTITNKEVLAKVEFRITDELEKAKAKIKQEEAEKAAEKQSKIAEKQLKDELYILGQEEKATKTKYDNLEFAARKNQKQLVAIQKERADEELRLLKERLKLEEKAEELKLKQDYKDEAEQKAKLKQLNDSYRSREAEAEQKAADAKVKIEEAAYEKRTKNRAALSSAFGAFLKGDMDGFLDSVQQMNTAEQKSWQKQLQKGAEFAQMGAQMAQQAISFLNDLAQQKADNAIKVVQREYEAKKAILEKELSENAAAIAAATENEKQIKADGADKVKQIKEESAKKIKDLEDAYREMNSVDSKKALDEQLAAYKENAEEQSKTAKDTAANKIANAQKVKQESIDAANEEKNTVIDAAKNG